jgi:hypothetical protein
MLLVYPMLVSQSVSKNIVPGLCKVIERYLLIRILQEHTLKLRSKTPHISVRESILIENSIDFEINKLLREFPEPGGTGNNEGEGERHTGVKKDKDKDKKEDKKDLRIDVEIGNDTFKTISLEPTYAQVSDIFGKVIYGVKVVAFPIKLEKEEDAFRLFNNDFQRNILDSLIRKVGRVVIKLMYSLRNKFLRLLSLSPSISGDPLKDIVYGGNASISDSVFITLSTGDINQEILNDPHHIKKLLKLNWNSFVICDETKKQTNICMRSFNGLCSTIQYSMMISGINKDLGKVYDGLEQLQLESRPFFRLRRF